MSARAPRRQRSRHRRSVDHRRRTVLIGTLSGVTITGDSGTDITVCDRFQGNDSGDEPSETGSGPDGTHGRYSTSDATYN